MNDAGRSAVSCCDERPAGYRSGSYSRHVKPQRVMYASYGVGYPLAEVRHETRARSQPDDQTTRDETCSEAVHKDGLPCAGATVSDR